MRPSTLYLGGVVAAVAGLVGAAPGTCGCNPAGKCLSAISEDAVVGEAFCASWLSLGAVTTVITSTETVTSTRTSIETTLTTVTETSTSTHDLGTTTLQVIARQADPTESILSRCSSRPARISNACGCFFSGSATAAATVTVYETLTSTEVPDYATTTIETITSNVVTTETAQATETVSVSPLVNGNFIDGYAPWSDSGANQGGSIEVETYPGEICSGPDYCAPYDKVILVTTPAYSDAIALHQTFTGRGYNALYHLSFMYLCPAFVEGEAPSIWLYFNGGGLGQVTCGPEDDGWRRAERIPLRTAPSQDFGTLSLIFFGPEGTSGIEIYATNFELTSPPVTT